jgi:glycosyltransferase involved in cell wall biosynthesis
MKFSIIVPVYNRPDELHELLSSLTRQDFTDFEVIIIEDGSTQKSDVICGEFREKLSLAYIDTFNQGQGFARNEGSKLAVGEYLLFFDSDVVLPDQYLAAVNTYLQNHNLDAYGGEDRARSDFSPLQKAISYSMTSFLTTGGIRNKNQSAVGNYQIRSYNLGIKREIFKNLGGFHKTNMGEDMELNARLDKLSITKSLIPEAFVYHKRRNTLGSFFKQIFSFGRTRIQLKRNYNIPIKVAHLLPLGFVCFILLLVVAPFLSLTLAAVLFSFLGIYLILNGIIAAIQNKSVLVGFKVMAVVFLQHTAYGLGFLYELSLGLK